MSFTVASFSISSNIIAKAAQLTLNEIVNPISFHPMNKSAQSETVSS